MAVRQRGAEEQRGREGRTVQCKNYHAPRSRGRVTVVRKAYQQKSVCPTWATDPDLQQAMIDEALEDTKGETDSMGRPKRLWNAVHECVFVGVSCNLREPRYNCYPETPPDGKLLGELLTRAKRTPDEVRRRGRVQ